MFSMQSPLFRAVSVILRFVGLNLLFLLGCLLIITIPAATAALFAVVRQMALGRDPHIWTGFWTAFRENLLQSSYIGALLGAVLLIMIVDARALSVLHHNHLGLISIGILWSAGILEALLALYLFPIMVHMQLPTQAVVTNAVKLCVYRPDLTILNALAVVFFTYCALRVPILFGGLYFSVCASTTYWIADKKFRTLLARQ